MLQNALTFIVALMQQNKRRWTTGLTATGLPIAGLIAMVLVLASLQLRWTTRIAEAERARLEQNLQRSTSEFQAAFARDLLEICQTFQSAPPASPKIAIADLSDRYALWRRIARNAALIDQLYIWPLSDARARTLLRFNPETQMFESIPWPRNLNKFLDQVEHSPGSLAAGQSSWLWDEDVPVLVHPLYLSKHGSELQPQLYGYLLAEFDADHLARSYLPTLGRRYFASSNGFMFQLMDHAAGAGGTVVYDSNDTTHPAPLAHPDAILSLLDSTIIYRPAPGGERSVSPAGTGPASVRLAIADATRWQIDVQYRSGSVNAAVVELRHRDLAISIAVLVVLLISLVLILITTRRARRLARQQMEFASGVSHELRTPLAVISSAAENLADGVVTEEDRIRNYGQLIHQESQRLSGMVDHILAFAQLDATEPEYPLEPIDVKAIVEALLANERTQILAAGVTVELKLEKNLPQVLTNATALRQCLQNLLSNGLKYGSSGKRIALEAQMAEEHGIPHVLLTVRDFGDGIAPEDLPHIFEPFYRADRVRESQIAGTGLGLSLTKKIMHGLGGHISVQSTPGQGSAFTLHVPLAKGREHHETTHEAAHMQ